MYTFDVTKDMFGIFFPDLKPFFSVPSTISKMFRFWGNHKKRAQNNLKKMETFFYYAIFCGLNTNISNFC
jgi:hypothetical protein